MMEPSKNLTRIVYQTRYSVETATLLASDRYWNGSNHDRNGRNTFLYRTPKKYFFKVKMSNWQGELPEELIPIDRETAIELYEGRLIEHLVSYEEAFPGVKVMDA